MRVSAPFSADQVASLNGYQSSGVFHEFTCGSEDCPADQATLIAAEDGWHCPACSYTQDWAHHFMADGSWRDFAGIVVTVDGGEPVKGEIGEREAPVCICPHFSDTGGFRIADLCCPVHGVGGTEPGDGYWDESP